jgi:hypothetical protein
MQFTINASDRATIRAVAARLSRTSKPRLRLATRSWRDPRTGHTKAADLRAIPEGVASEFDTTWPLVLNRKIKVLSKSPILEFWIYAPEYGERDEELEDQIQCEFRDGSLVRIFNNSNKSLWERSK